MLSNPEPHGLNQVVQGLRIESFDHARIVSDLGDKLAGSAREKAMPSRSVEELQPVVTAQGGDLSARKSGQSRPLEQRRDFRDCASPQVRDARHGLPKSPTR